MIRPTPCKPFDMKIDFPLTDYSVDEKVPFRVFLQKIKFIKNGSKVSIHYLHIFSVHFGHSHSTNFRVFNYSVMFVIFYFF